MKWVWFLSFIKVLLLYVGLRLYMFHTLIMVLYKISINVVVLINKAIAHITRIQMKYDQKIHSLQ